MGTTNLMLIFAAETLALSLFVIAVLLLKNRNLRRTMKKLQNRLESALKQLRQPKAAAPPPTEPAPAVAPPETYRDKLDEQLELTRNHHYELGSRQDIALDLDPDSPLPRRTAALRHALLIAEKEATADGGEFGWDLLATRYNQIFTYNEDYTPPPKDAEGDLSELQDQLEQANKRINNLERFKTMYFDLEERWDKCKTQANEHVTELRIFADKTDHKEDLNRLIDEYHTSYNGIDSIIGKNSNTDDSYGEGVAEAHLSEIRRLRGVAADQHRIINELQEQLVSANSNEERVEFVQSLQGELQKQSRFLQESETCIKLMEDELANAQNEIELLRSKVAQTSKLKAAIKELEIATATRDQIVESLKQENRRLAKKLKLTQEAPPEDSQESRQLRKELSTMQSKYNDLEEKFLNLKLKG